MLGLKLNHVSKGGPRSNLAPVNPCSVFTEKLALNYMKIPQPIGTCCKTACLLCLQIQSWDAAAGSAVTAVPHHARSTESLVCGWRGSITFIIDLMWQQGRTPQSTNLRYVYKACKSTVSDAHGASIFSSLKLGQRLNSFVTTRATICDPALLVSMVTAARPGTRNW